jgi:hypothetical protein
MAMPMATGSTISSTAVTVTASPSTTKANTAKRSVRPTKIRPESSQARYPVMTVVCPLR